ncbi:hypothetical protein FDC64_11230 [Clostridium botulinum]|uniref:hypothetical protein n=3 Tax=Clostridium botulinum TaxID=1491 RepID=UPI000773F7EC|nr:hypothetical protein [Clostridium botulinum]MBY6773652.1 hypothetical protein [Clostridium botulinum]MBY6864240.1 hypothetical protein [Clostridium botulinum]MBY6984816.1 hypothetical protein [Clostridium botulinum]NFP26129.1 hypothetical protein [Clostridium botulinum]
MYLNRVGNIKEEEYQSKKDFFKKLQKGLYKSNSNIVPYIVRRTFFHNYYDLITVIDYKNETINTIPLPLYMEALNKITEAEKEDLTWNNYTFPVKYNYLLKNFKIILQNEFEDIKQKFNISKNKKYYENNIDLFKKLKIEIKENTSVEFEGYTYDKDYTIYSIDGFKVTKQDVAVFENPYPYDDEGNFYGDLQENYGDEKTITLREFIEEYEYAIENKLLKENI